MSKTKENIGFGFDPNESKHHFLVIISKNANAKVLIYERFEWGNPDELEKLNGEFSLFDAPEQKIDQRFDRLKCELSRTKWREIEGTLRAEFNQRLKESGQKAGNWKQGQNAIQRLLGKEMTLLCWAIEDASTGDSNTKYGWRTAVRYALTENPVTDKFQQRSIFDIYLEDKSDLAKNNTD
jgi:hypothetical protein